MAGAAKLVFVELVARTQKFNASLKKADAQVAKSTMKMKVMAGVLATSLILGLRKVAREFDEFADKGDSLAKLARGLRLNVNELQELQFVLERTGGAGSSVRNMMLAMDKALGDAAGGSKEYVDSFKALNLDFKELIKLDPAARFWEIRRAIQASKGEVEASAGAQIILGRGFKANVSTMAETEASVLAVREEYKKLGGVSQTAADLAEQVKDLETNWGLLKDTIGSTAFELVAPGVITSTEAFQAWIIEMKESGKLVAGVKVGLVVMAALFLGLGAIIVGLVATFAAPVLAIAGIIAGFTLLIGTIVANASELGQAIKLVFNDVWDFVAGLGEMIAAEISEMFDFELPAWVVKLGVKTGIIDPEERKRELKEGKGRQEERDTRAAPEVPEMLSKAAGLTPAPLGSGVGLKTVRPGADGSRPVEIKNFYQVSGSTANQLQSMVRSQNEAQLRTNKRGE